jgi:hypothetical protein
MSSTSQEGGVTQGKEENSLVEEMRAIAGG